VQSDNDETHSENKQVIDEEAAGEEEHDQTACEVVQNKNG